MSAKRKARELAMQILFVWDVQGQADDASASQLAKDRGEEDSVQSRALEMARGAWGQKDPIDAWVERLAPQWPPRRQPSVDRNLIRLAVWELTNTTTPPKVVLDEAIEIAKEFSTENSAAFINGVLDSVLKEHRALIEGAPAKP